MRARPLVSFGASGCPLVISSERSVLSVIPSERSESSDLHLAESRSLRRAEELITRRRGGAEDCNCSPGRTARHRCSAPLHARSKSKDFGIGIQPLVAPRPCSVLPVLRGSAGSALTKQQVTRALAPLSGRSRFLDSLRSLGMTEGSCARSVGMTSRGSPPRLRDPPRLRVKTHSATKPPEARRAERNAQSPPARLTATRTSPPLPPRVRASRAGPRTRC